MASISLPNAQRRLQAYRLVGEPLPAPSAPQSFNRVTFSAAHVVADPLSAHEPSVGPAIDWKATIACRRYLLGLGLGIAEAMDTAQRGMGLVWNGALERIRLADQARLLRDPPLAVSRMRAFPALYGVAA